MEAENNKRKDHISNEEILQECTPLQRKKKLKVKEISILYYKVERGFIFLNEKGDYFFLM